MRSGDWHHICFGMRLKRVNNLAVINAKSDSQRSFYSISTFVLCIPFKMKILFVTCATKSILFIWFSKFCQFEWRHLYSHYKICRFKLQLTLKNHIASVHERSYCQICEICAKTFKTKQGFREHLETHKDTEETRVQCSYCNAMLKNRVSLKTHIRRSHKSTPKKCPFCDKIKPNQQSLTSHIMVVHTRPTHFCTICDKSFTKALSLTVSENWQLQNIENHSI